MYIRGVKKEKEKQKKWGRGLKEQGGRERE
jgi:hypothetical protein